MLRIAIISLVFAAGCGKDVTADVEKLADRACACTDATCAQKVVDELVTLMKGNKDARGDQKRAEKAATRLGGCVIKAGVDPTKFMEQIQAVTK